MIRVLFSFLVCLSKEDDGYHVGVMDDACKGGVFHVFRLVNPIN
jgi:hypothetical protein